ncbi:MAG: hypothetical protein MJE77_34385 [Proteobacteria bacterium]|nr:hypothetical protein [Pseudomonadota bacterium]
MSLPISGGGPGVPGREPTHKALDLRKMMNLGMAVEEAAGDEPITVDAIDELALEEGVDTSHLYAAAAMTTEVEFARHNDVAFVTCGGNCQHWGALECIEHLVSLRQKRIEAGKTAFDIEAKRCLDKCEHGPVVLVRSPLGTAVIARATKESLSTAVAETCDSSPADEVE